ncbi:unnamed protein product [Angiostrongylus costaricensis]|uniref:ShTK domain protein n=1 Tax=Angiostrongylus costaricensis TaxID=334426 RepID=A0A158PKJ7_ANGCS|nr:unnamed protein product [Angiostrongylus costaricensis]
MGADDRNERCYKLRNNVDPDLVQAAVDFCPQTCGYCCITPEFNCEDKRFPSVMCSKVTPDMCAAPAWKPVLAENCPKTCGLCTDASEMFRVFVLMMLFSDALGADIVDLNCTQLVGDKYKLRDNVDPDLVQAAVDVCPRTCGYCCITPEFSCEDKRFPSVMCSKVTPDMCAAPAWKPVLAENCLKTCGLCTDASGKLQKNLRILPNRDQPNRDHKVRVEQIQSEFSSFERSGQKTLLGWSDTSLKWSDTSLKCVHLQMC